MDLVDNGHTIQVTNNAPIAFDHGGEHYKLDPYHSHAASEHMIDGAHAPLEVHFVHKSATRTRAALGELEEVGDHSSVCDLANGALPPSPSEERRRGGFC